MKRPAGAGSARGSGVKKPLLPSPGTVFFRAVKLRPLAVLILVSLAAPLAAQTTSPEINLTVKRGPGALDVTLEWTGGQPSFEVYRSADPSAVCRADTLLGVTDIPSWIDVAPPDTVFYKWTTTATASSTTMPPIVMPRFARPASVERAGTDAEPARTASTGPARPAAVLVRHA